MNEIPVLADVVLVVIAAVVAIVALTRLHVPVVGGLLLAGAVIGPHGLELLPHPHRINALAEVGVVLLLFTIGLEFSTVRLVRIWRLVAVGGMLQVGLTVLLTLAACVLAGLTVPRGLFVGFLMALSSTAIVLRGLSERAELDAPHGRVIVGALIFQDLCVVPMVVAVPILASSGGQNPWLAVGLALAKAAAAVLAALFVARWLLPRAFAAVDAARSREVFQLAVLSVCIGTALLTSLAGLSLALGAFLAGVVLADSDYGERALGDILPLRDVLASLFFVSLGMLFNPQALLSAPLLVLLLLAGLLLGKALIAMFAALLMGLPPRVAWLAGVGLAQFGEFGFVLAQLGKEHGLIDQPLAERLLAAGVMSMFVSPLAMAMAPRIKTGERLLQPVAHLLLRLPWRGAATTPSAPGMRDHVIVVGFGIAGQQLAEGMAAVDLPYVVLELNADRVRRARREGQPVAYADATSVDALAHAGLTHARAVVLLINDAFAVRRAVHAIHHAAPHVAIVARCRYVTDRPLLLQLGATEVVVEEFEAGLQIMSRVLQRMGVPPDVALRRIDAARAEPVKPL